VVIKNGGSDEPTVELKGGTSEPQASQQRFSTEQLTAATEENLKKTAERQLNPSQQETVNQTKQFMDQAKSAVAAGDVERGHNLAKKAYLLSEELLKP
jgi:homogentisate 1,2-dioxygenase